VEGFSALLRQAQIEKQIAGVSFGTQGPTVTHLLFADDNIIFLEASEESMAALRGVLLSYEACSGQRVNLQNVLKTRIGIACEELSEKYSGLPTVVGRSKEGAFKHVVDRSWGKVHGWNHY
jgi:hypothetical protein